MVGVDGGTGADKDHTALGLAQGREGLLNNIDDREEVDVKVSRKVGRSTNAIQIVSSKFLQGDLFDPAVGTEFMEYTSSSPGCWQQQRAKEDRELYLAHKSSVSINPTRNLTRFQRSQRACITYPAFKTSPSTRPDQDLEAIAKASAPVDSSVTSPTTNLKRSLSWRSCSMWCESCSRLSFERATPTTLAPWRSIASKTMLRPIPREAPVTMRVGLVMIKEGVDGRNEEM